MANGKIPDRDSLFRQCVYPLAFRSSNRFAQDKLLRFTYEQSSGTLRGSLAWERFVPTTDLVHSHGCRLAFRMNEDLRTAGKFKENARRVYCGSYQMNGKTIRALPTSEGLNEILSADVIHDVEAGEIAHTTLKIVLIPERVFDIEGTKTAIVDHLWNRCYGPLRHVCDCDKSMVAHPGSNLPDGPAGQYSDGRFYLRKLWHIIRFTVCEWLWRKGWWHPRTCGGA